MEIEKNKLKKTDKGHLLFSKIEALREDDQNVPLSGDYSTESDRIKKRLKDALKANKNQILAFVGKFGSGKSVLLRNIENELSGSNLHWLNFDVWRYADRQQIWDGFVIELIEKVNKEERNSIQVAGKIDGYSYCLQFIQDKAKQLLVLTIIIWTILSFLIWQLLINYDFTFKLFVIVFLKYGQAPLFAILVIFGLGEIFPRKSPAKRVFELENSLKSCLRDMDRSVIIAIEDIDRAGEEGIVFMETLRRFIDKYMKEINNRIIVISPQSSTYLTPLGNDRINFLDRSLKIYDSIIYFSQSSVKYDDLASIINLSEINQKYKDVFLKTVEILSNHYIDQMNIRKFKFILREVNEFFMAYKGSDPSIALTFIFYRYIISIEEKTSKEDIALNIFKANYSNIAWAPSSAKTLARLLYDIKTNFSNVDDGNRVSKFDFLNIPKDEIVYKNTISSGPSEKYTELKVDTKYSQILR